LEAILTDDQLSERRRKSAEELPSAQIDKERVVKLASRPAAADLPVGEFRPISRHGEHR
jgi:hypothetical protein